jgi:hypothetical protein
MSACARCRWGPGTTIERPPNTENAKQLEGGLVAIMAARQAQDTQYFPNMNQINNTTENLTKNSNIIRNGSK